MGQSFGGSNGTHDSLFAVSPILDQNGLRVRAEQMIIAPPAD